MERRGPAQERGQDEHRGQSGPQRRGPREPQPAQE